MKTFKLYREDGELTYFYRGRHGLCASGVAKALGCSRRDPPLKIEVALSVGAKQPKFTSGAWSKPGLRWISGTFKRSSEYFDNGYSLRVFDEEQLFYSETEKALKKAFKNLWRTETTFWFAIRAV